MFSIYYAKQILPTQDTMRLFWVKDLITKVFAAWITIPAVFISLIMLNLTRIIFHVKGTKDSTNPSILDVLIFQDPLHDDSLQPGSSQLSYTSPSTGPCHICTSPVQFISPSDVTSIYGSSKSTVTPSHVAPSIEI